LQLPTLIIELFRWSDSLACNTVHIDDFSSALVSAAIWAESLGSRSSILSAHSVNLPPAIDSNKPLEPLTSGPSPVKPAKKEEKDIRAALFNVEDGGDTRQKAMAKLIEEVVGVKTGWHGIVISTFAKLNLDVVHEDANEKLSSSSSIPPQSHSDLCLQLLQHLEGWSALMQASNINTTVPISPQVPVDLLSPNPISFDSSALKRLTGWAPTHKLDAATVRATIEGFRKEGFWPNAPPQK